MPFFLARDLSVSPPLHLQNLQFFFLIPTSKPVSTATVNNWLELDDDEREIDKGRRLSILYWPNPLAVT